MTINTLRPEETCHRDTYAGFHQFHDEDQRSYGSFEIYYDEKEGWLWQSCFPGCLPDGEPMGPFASSFAALLDADEYNPAIGWYFEE